MNIFQAAINLFTLFIITLSFSHAQAQSIQNEMLTVSLTLLQSDMDSQLTGILHPDNRESRGLESKGEFILTGRSGEILKHPVGVRLHGGHSRHSEAPSFRVYFAEGKRNILDNSIDKELWEMLKSASRLVVHRANDLVNFVAFDIAKALGATVPRTQPVTLILNGRTPSVTGDIISKRSMGVYFLSDHLKLKEWLVVQKIKNLRHKDDKGKKVYFHKFKSVITMEQELALENFCTVDKETTCVSDDELKAMVGGKSLLAARRVYELKQLILVTPKVDMNFAKKHFRLDNLIDHLLSIVITGTTDWRQGIAIKERDRDNRWHFINWDMEHSFYDYNNKNYRSKEGLPPRPEWRQEGFELIMASGVKWWKQGLSAQRPLRKWDIRALVFYRLWMEDPKFRLLVKEKFNEAKNLFNQQWVDQTVTRYQGLVSGVQSPHFDPSQFPDFKSFFSCRFLFLEHQLENLDQYFAQQEQGIVTYKDKHHVPSDQNWIWTQAQWYQCSGL